MNKAELVEAVSDRVEEHRAERMTKANIDRVLTLALEVIEEQVAAGNKVSLVGFGHFEPRHRKERKGRNPKSGEEMVIPARTAPVFTAGKVFKRLVGGS